MALYFPFSAILPEYERLLRFSEGKYTGIFGPGWVWLIPFLHRSVTVDLRESLSSQTERVYEYTLLIDLPESGNLRTAIFDMAREFGRPV